MPGIKVAWKNRNRQGEDGHISGLGQCVNVGSDYTAEQLEYMRAVEAWKKTNRRRYPATTDYLAILLGLGYRREGGTLADGLNRTGAGRGQ
jgi:hypothetical protein